MTLQGKKLHEVGRDDEVAAMPGRWAGRAAAVFLVALLMAAGCSSSDDGDAVAGSGELEANDGEGGQRETEPAHATDTNESSADASGDDAEAGETAEWPQPGSVPSPAGGADPATLEGEELEAYIADRYEAYWEAYDVARGAPTNDPAADFPALAMLAAGEQLEVSYDAVTDLATKGEAVAESTSPAIDGVDSDSEHRVKVTVIDATIAEVDGCFVNDDVQKMIESGTIVREGVRTVLSESTMAFSDGDWKLIRSRAMAIVDGVGGCWLEAEANFPH